MSELAKYCGVGLHYDRQKTNGFTVVVLSSLRTTPTPAQIAGIQTGDIITNITYDGQQHYDPNLIDHNALFGPPESTVKVTVLHEGIKREVTLIRDFIVTGKLNGPLIDDATLEKVPLEKTASCDFIISQDPFHGLPASLQRISDKEQSPS